MPTILRKTAFFAVTCLICATAPALAQSSPEPQTPPWATYQCIGEPASTSMDGDTRLQAWPLSGQVGNDLVVCDRRAASGGVFVECFELASGGADHSADPDPASFAQSGYVQWNDGTGGIIECRQPA